MSKAMSDWQTVPKVLTEAMLNAPLADDGDIDLPIGKVSGKKYESRRDLRPLIWAKLLAAAPPPPAVRVTPDELDEIYTAARDQFLHDNDGAQFSNHAAHIAGLRAVLAVSFPIQQDGEKKP